MSPLSRTAVCLIALAVAIALWRLKKQPKPHAVAAFVAVAGLAGGAVGGPAGGAVGGWLPRVLLWITHWYAMGEDKLTVMLLGATDPGIVATIIAGTAIGLVIHDLWPKNTAKRHTVILAALAPLLMLAAGGQMAAAVHGNLNTASPPAITRIISANHPGV